MFGTTRWFFRLEGILNKSLHKPLKPKHHDIKYLIWFGLYQLLETNIAQHAIINETVEATRLLQKPWASKLVNRILRQFVRNKNKSLNEVKKIKISGMRILSGYQKRHNKIGLIIGKILLAPLIKNHHYHCESTNRKPPH